ncbi:MAG: TonB-dependent receptor, partial [Steroidobacteraceae bacterium]|nr:TonB-dependent receptor [Steroidobacteraceae bacterium]
SHRRTALSLAIAVALGLPVVGYGQEAPPPPPAEAELEEVVVTGIRAGIESAIAVKQQSMSIVEAISAEDIGKLPDTSIAESIARLPGLTSQRAEGRASAISLRGTDPGFTTALLNGREQVSTGDNRNVEFDQYPSELISQVVVYKTPDAKLVGQGLAGTIDLRTVQPLDYGKQAVVLNLRGEMNSNDNLGADADEMGFRASFSYVDQFMDGKLGFAFGYAHLDSPLATRGFGTYEPWKLASESSPDANVNPGVPGNVYLTEGFKVRTDMGSTERDGFMTALQFEPNDFYSTSIDLYYSTMDQENNARMLEVPTASWQAAVGDPGVPDTAPINFTNVTVRGGGAVAGTLNNVPVMARNFLFLTDDEILAGGWRNEFMLGDTWTLVADLSYSKAEREQEQYETNAAIEGSNGQRYDYDTGTFNLRNGDMPTLTFQNDYADPSRVRLGPTPFGSGWSKLASIEDELTSFRMDAIRDAEVWWFDQVAVGANYSDRSKVKTGDEGGINTPGGAWVTVTNPITSVNLNYANAGRSLAWDVRGALRDYYDPIVYNEGSSTPWLLPKNWTVDEEVVTGYIRGELNHDISDTVTLRGNLGLQVISTDQSSTSWRVENAYSPEQRIIRFTDGKTYTDVLPQLNFAFLLPDSMAVRVGIAEEMARARMDQLKASQEVGFNRSTGIPAGSGGNPKLDPWRATAFDLSFEKYFYENRGYVSTAVFYKDLDSYIYTQTDPNHDFSDALAALPPGYFDPGVTPKATGNYSGPVNGEGGYLWGLEFAASVPFDIFHDALDGFGAIFAYSYTDSGIEVAGNINNVTKTDIPLPGLSQDVMSATLYYEKHGFGARIATRYRSEYIGEVTNFANDRALRFVDSDTITDAQLSYLFGTGTLEGLQLLFQVNNLTNEPYVAYVEDQARILDYQEYGTQYLVGLNYRF